MESLCESGKRVGHAHEASVKTHIFNNPGVHSAICLAWMKGINTLPAFHGDLTCCFSWNDGSPVNIRGGSVQVAPHCALCIAPSTRAPCCIGTSKSNTSGPLRNWKNRITEIQLQSDKTDRGSERRNKPNELSLHIAGMCTNSSLLPSAGGTKALLETCDIPAA